MNDSSFNSTKNSTMVGELADATSPYSWQRGSSKQSVLTQPLSGGGDVRLESVVQWGKQGSGDQPFVVVSDFNFLPSSTVNKLCFNRNIFNWIFHNLRITCKWADK